MPLYDYHCQSCGDFRDWCSLADYDAPAPCPVCAALAPRSIALPYLSPLGRVKRIVHERNELSAYEPKVARREDLDAGRYGTRRLHAHHQNRGGGGAERWKIGH